MRHQSHALTLAISFFSPSECFHSSADKAQGTLASTPWIKSLECDFERVEASRCRSRPEDEMSLQTGLSEERNPLVFSSLTWTLSKCQVAHTKGRKTGMEYSGAERIRALEKLMAFHNSEFVWRGFKEQGYLSQFGKFRKGLLLSNWTTKKITSAISCLNIHFSGLKYSHQNATFIHMQSY